MTNWHFPSFLIVFLISWFALLTFWLAEDRKAESVDDSAIVTQIVDQEISISSPDDMTMSPSIGGVTGGSSSGQTTWTVKTNANSGFSLALKASTSPALASGSDSFGDYTPASAGIPDYNWGISSSNSEFGYSIEPETETDTIVAFLDNGSNACNQVGGSDGENNCWLNFSTTSYIAVNRLSVTDSTGESEIVKFKAQSDASHIQPAGTYTATITATASIN